MQNQQNWQPTYTQRDLGAVSAIFLLFLPLLYLSFSYGIQLIDDHEILVLNRALNGPNPRPFFSFLYDWTLQDIGLHQRFRPFYWVFRMLQTILWGTDYRLWAITLASTGLATAFLLYYCGRSLQLDPSGALLFAGLTLCGPQAAIWWRQGPQESLGIFLLASAWALLLSGQKAEPRAPWRSTCAILLLFAGSLSKESFIVFLPAQILAFLAYNRHRHQLTWRDTLKKEMALILCSGLFFTSTIALVLFYFRLSGPGQSGLDLNSLLLSHLLPAATGYFWNGLLFVPASCFIIVYFWQKTAGNLPPPYRAIGIASMVLLLALLPQIVIHAKGGVYERYYLPGLWATALYCAFARAWLPELAPKSGRAQLRIAMSIVLFGGCALHYYSSSRHLVAFVQKGAETAAMFEHIVASGEQTSPVILLMDPAKSNEECSSVSKFLKYKFNRTNLYYAWMQTANYSAHSKQIATEITTKLADRHLNKLAQKSTATAYVIYQPLERFFLANSPWFEPQLFARSTAGRLVYYYLNSEPNN